MFKAADVFEQTPTLVTLEARRVETPTHGVDDPTDDGLLAASAYDRTVRKRAAGVGMAR